MLEDNSFPKKKKRRDLFGSYISFFVVVASVHNQSWFEVKRTVKKKSMNTSPEIE